MRNTIETAILAIALMCGLIWTSGTTAHGLWTTLASAAHTSSADTGTSHTNTYGFTQPSAVATGLEAR